MHDSTLPHVNAAKYGILSSNKHNHKCVQGNLEAYLRIQIHDDPVREPQFKICGGSCVLYLRPSPGLYEPGMSQIIYLAPSPYPT